jgi:hypothetical protein
MSVKVRNYAVFKFYIDFDSALLAHSSGQTSVPAYRSTFDITLFSVLYCGPKDVINVDSTILHGLPALSLQKHRAL